MAKLQSRNRAVALDLGGTRFRVAVGTDDGSIEWRVSRFTGVHRGLQPVLNDLYDTVEDALSAVDDRETVQGMGIAAPGPLDPWTGVIHNPPNMPGWHSVPLKALFEERFGIPVQVANDANLAAVGEHRYGAGKGFQNVVYVTVSTGIGGGVIVDDRLLLGAGGFAGEVGHMTIDMRGERCACGNLGCLEWLASGTSIGRQARQLVRSGAHTALRGLPLDQITAHRVSELAYQGDAVARRLLRDAGVAMGVGIVNLVHMFNPQRVILGGGVSLNAGPLWWDAIQVTVRARAMESCSRGLEIVPAGLGDDAGLLGGVAIAALDTSGRAEPAATPSGAISLSPGQPAATGRDTPEPNRRRSRSAADTAPPPSRRWPA
ncbi:MAG: ROK family protein [Chloroflexota bacterium]